MNLKNRRVELLDRLNYENEMKDSVANWPRK